jgi:hypothetical protein
MTAGGIFFDTFGTKAKILINNDRTAPIYIFMVWQMALTVLLYLHSPAEVLVVVSVFVLCAMLGQIMDEIDAWREKRKKRSK